MTKKKRSSKKKASSKKLSKKQKDTLDDMKVSREEDNIRLRKRIEELIKQSDEDRKKLLETKQIREEQLQTLNIQLIKNKGAIDILMILLGKNNG